MTQTQKRNITISLHPEVIQKARIIAVKRSTSISGLVAQQIEALVGDDEVYERAAASAIARMKRGFHLGGGPMAGRDELHDRKNLR
jgi:2-hydroxychromene-2-carboxylate isomerase